VYNAKGELVATVVDREMTEGRKEVVWTATNDHGATVASGIYFYRLVAGEFVQTKKMVLLR
jgi:flagellar hook assembly protein FlgD